MEEKAKACPFCGVIPDIIVTKPDNEKYVMCYNLDCPLLKHTDDDIGWLTLEEWNTRYDDEGNKL